MKTKRSLRIFVILFTLLFIAVVYYLNKTPDSIKAVINKNKISELEPSVLFCGKPISESKSFIDNFESFSRSKLSGSHPTYFYPISIRFGTAEFNFHIGKDSRESNLYWIYDYDEPRIKGSLGYFELTSFTVGVENSCDELVQTWIYEFLPTSQRH
jgi:hypothetical protein